MNGAVPLLKFTPSAQDPQVLEAITVQREPLIAQMVEDALDLAGGARHRLLIGPRGMGKTHILALVASRVRAADSGSHVLAWLEEDPWAIGTYEKFLAAIIARVAEEQDDPELVDAAKRLRAGGTGDELDGEQVLRDALGESRLVLLVENLDEVFRRIDVSGQERFRAFLENWDRILVLASAPQLFEGVQLHESPFYGFFAITHLEELSLDSANRLMRLIAEQRGDDELAEFLGTDTARRRLAAIEALAGGHPRIWLLLSGCVSIRAIDELVPLFLEALDDLTPYYQDRLHELGDQQQELVVLMSEAGGALSNRALSELSGIAQNQVATMLKHLCDRGYVRRAEIPAELATGDARMSHWELREPLMRLCLDLKQAKGEPLRMVVEFLRAWYGPRLLDELAVLPSTARLAVTYAEEAFRTLEGELPSEDLFRGSPEEMVERVELGLSLTPEDPALMISRATALILQDRPSDARKAFMELIEESEADAVRMVLGALLFEVRDAVKSEIGARELEWKWSVLGEVDANGDEQALPDFAAIGLTALGFHERALEFFPAALALDLESRFLAETYGFSLSRIGRYEEALGAFDKAVALAPDSARLQMNRGNALSQLDRDDEALAAFERAVELAPESGSALVQIGTLHFLHDRPEEALAAFDHADVLNDDERELKLFCRALALRQLGRLEEAERAAREVVSLASVPTPMHALSLAEIMAGRGEIVGGLAELKEAFALLNARPDPDEADPELVVETLWNASSERDTRRDLMELAVRTHEKLAVGEELGRELVGSIAQMADPETSLEVADAWVEDWSKAGADIGNLEIPLTMLRAARDWKRDRDRSHLLKLPPEQREILLGMIEAAG